MKYSPLIFFFALLFLSSCQEKSSSSSSSSSSSNSDNLCAGTAYYSVPGCPGHVAQGGTTGTTTSGCEITSNYWQQAGCQGFCQINPTHSSCSTSPNNGTTTNPFTNSPSVGVTPNWGVKSPGGVPTGSCTSAVAPTGVSYTPYETRKATMTIVGKSFYNPTSPTAPNYLNTSSLLRSQSGSATFFSTDSLLKVRFKVLPQPESSNASPYCYGRQSGASIAGYTKLQFNVELFGTKANGAVEREPIGTYTVGVNACTTGIDLSSYASTYPGGIYVVVQSVKGNQGYFPPNYDFYGFRDVDSFVDIRTQDCWSLDIEVAADGTKTFD